LESGVSPEKLRLLTLGGYPRLCLLSTPWSNPAECNPDAIRRKAGESWRCFFCPKSGLALKLMTMPAANTVESAAPVLRDSFPRMMVLRQKQFPASPPLDISASLEAQFAALRSRIKPGSRLAVAVGSRGISNCSALSRAVLAF